MALLHTYEESGLGACPVHETNCKIHEGGVHELPMPVARSLQDQASNQPHMRIFWEILGDIGSGAAPPLRPFANKLVEHYDYDGLGWQVFQKGDVIKIGTPSRYLTDSVLK